jgi:hypothetical protein
MSPIERICNRCNKTYIEHPAISRRDNNTRICSECGNEEAFIDYYSLKKMSDEQQKRELTFREFLDKQKKENQLE